MTDVLTMNAKIECGHGGAVDIFSEVKLRVDSKPVLLKESVDGKSVSLACTTQPDNSGHKKCTKASVTGTEAAKLTVGGKGVLLDQLSGKTDGNPIGTPTVTGGTQSKLTAK